MDALFLFPVLIIGIGIARAIRLKGWNGFVKSDFHPNIPVLAKILMIGAVLFELAVHAIFASKALDVQLAKLLISPHIPNAVASIIFLAVLFANWGGTKNRRRDHQGLMIE